MIGLATKWTTGPIDFEMRLGSVEQMANSFAALGQTATKQIVRCALRAGAQVVLAAARRLAPVRTGALRSSLRVHAMPRSRLPGRFGVEVRTEAEWFRGQTFYAAFLEFGYNRGKRPYRRRGSRPASRLGRPRKTLPDDVRPRIEGLHFMERAWDETSELAMLTIESEIMSGVERALKT